MDGVRSGPDEGERFENDVRLALIKAALPHLTVLEFTAEGAYEGPDPHTHEDHTDSFYVLEGELELTLGEETFLAGTQPTQEVLGPGAVDPNDFLLHDGRKSGL